MHSVDIRHQLFQDTVDTTSVIALVFCLIAIIFLPLHIMPSSVLHMGHYGAEKGENSLEISQQIHSRFEKRTSDLPNHSQALYPLGYTSSLSKWNYPSRKKDS